MTATYTRISDRNRGVGYQVALPEVGDRLTIRFLAPYGSIIPWQRSGVSWRSAGAAVVVLAAGI